MPINNDFGNVQDLVDIKDIRKSTVIMKSGVLRQVIMVGGTNFSLKSEAEQNIITQAYQNFLNSIDFPLQIIVHSRKINIERYLSNLDIMKEKEGSALLQDQIGEYQEFVRGFIKDNPIMAKTFFAVVPHAPAPMQSVAASGSSFFDSLPLVGKKPGSAKAKIADEDRAKADQAAFEETLLQLKQRVLQVTQGLSAVGLECVVLNDEQLVELFYNFYNPETIEKREALTPIK